MSELPSISDKFSDDVTEQREIRRKMDNANFISVPDWACCATTVAAERLILGLVWKLGNPSKNKRAMGFYAKSKWIEERYHLSKNTISRAYTSLKNKGFIQKRVMAAGCLITLQSTAPRSKTLGSPRNLKSTDRLSTWASVKQPS